MIRGLGSRVLNVPSWTRLNRRCAGVVSNHRTRSVFAQMSIQISAPVTTCVALLVASGRAVLLINHALKQLLAFHVAALDEAARDLRKAYPFPAQFRTGEAREVLKTTRKYIVPILEHLDTQGVTVRTGDLRHLAKDTSPGSNGRDDVSFNHL